MRKDRGISRSKLVIISSSISSLKRFENDGAKIDFDILWACLERMNIHMDEYQLEYSNYHNSQKEQLRIRFKNVLSNESDIKEYLEKVSDWGYFELAMYTNCLSLFEDNYLLFNLNDVLAQFEKFKTSYKYKLVLILFLVNSLILSFERMSYDKIPKLLEVLFTESEDSDFMKGRIYWKFNSLYHSVNGNFEMDNTI
jgi:Rgg/GadR/MutR family transcriptional activator